MEPTRVNIRELKNRLSHYLRLTKAGQTVEITDRGRPIGRIIPMALPLADRIEAAVRAGLVGWNGQRLESRPPVAKAKGEKTVAGLVVEDRQ